MLSGSPLENADLCAVRAQAGRQTSRARRRSGCLDAAARQQRTPFSARLACPASVSTPNRPAVPPSPARHLRQAHGHALHASQEGHHGGVAVQPHDRDVLHKGGWVGWVGAREATAAQEGARRQGAGADARPTARALASTAAPGGLLEKPRNQRTPVPFPSCVSVPTLSSWVPLRSLNCWVPPS